MENSDTHTSTPLVRRLLCKSPKNLMTVCYLAREKRENNKYSILPVVPLDPTFKWALPPQNQPLQNYHPTTFIIHHHQHYLPHTKNMPLQQAVLYQAFHKITNFIRNNRDDWDEFCTKTAHTTRKAKKTPNPSKKQPKHKIAKIEGLLAPEPLLQENPHRFVLFPIHHADIWWMYKKAAYKLNALSCLPYNWKFSRKLPKTILALSLRRNSNFVDKATALPSGRQKRLTFQQTSRTGSDCPTPNVTSSPMSLHSLLPLMGSSTRT